MTGFTAHDNLFHKVTNQGGMVMAQCMWCGDYFTNGWEMTDIHGRFHGVVCSQKCSAEYRQGKDHLFVRVKQGSVESETGASYDDHLSDAEINARMYCNRGWSAKRSGKFDEAIDHFNNAISLNPNKKDDYYAGRGQAYLEKKQFTQAINDFTKAIELNPNTDDHYYQRGMAYLEKSQFDKAIEDFTMQIDMGSSCYKERGEAYLRRGDKKQAIADLEKKLKWVVDQGEDRGWIDEEEKKEIEKLLKKARALPDTPSIAPLAAAAVAGAAIGAAAATGGKAVCPSCGKSVPPGKFCFECGAPMQKTCPHCNAQLPAGAKFCLECGKPAGAAAAAPPADVKTSSSIDVAEYCRRGDECNFKKQFNEAIDNLNAAIALDPKYAPAYNLRGQSYYLRGNTNKSIGDIQQAIRDLEKSLDLEPENPFARKFLRNANETLKIALGG